MAISRDTKAASAISPAPSQQAEYDAVLAAVTATERGRWFLAEYASRNRQVDSGSIVAGIARIETAIRGEAEPTGVPDIAAAVERIQDVACNLRQRAVDSALCDALDAAAREIVAALAGHEPNGNRALGIVDLLRDLSSRLDTLIELSGVGQSPGDLASMARPSEVEAVPGDQPAPDLESGTPADGGDEAATTAPEAQSAASDSPSELDGGSPPVAAEDRVETPAAAAPPAPTSKQPSDPGWEPSVEPTAAEAGPRWYIEPPDFAFQYTDRRIEVDYDEPPTAVRSTHALLPQTQLQPGPEDDPADLFDAKVPSFIRPPELAPMTTARPIVPEPAAEPSPQARDGTVNRANGSPAPNAVARPATDPLGDLRALTAEELIALFG